MDNQTNITTAFGRINLPGSSMTLACFKVTAPFAKTAASNAGRVMNRNNSPATRRQEGGGFTTTSSGFPEGTIIMLQATRTRRASLVSQAAMFLRLRSGAPLIRVAAKLITGPETLLGDSFNAFLGHADVLAYNELRVLGIEIPRKYRAAYMQEDELAENFEIEIVSPGSTERPVFIAVATSQGVEFKATAPEPVRRIRLRGK